MKMVFEYEDGTYRVVPLISIIDIEARTIKNRLVDQYVYELGLKNKYMIADDNRIAGFEAHKDVRKVRKEIEELEKMIELKKKVLEYYSGLEDLSVHSEKAVITTEEAAVNEIFDYVIRREKHELYTGKP